MSKSLRSRFTRLTILALLGPAGCGQADAPVGSASLRSVSGRVTSGGRPAAGVEVRLHPLNRANDPSAPKPVGVTDKEGRYTLRTGDAEGTPDGPYQVSLTWPSGRGNSDRFGGAFEDPQGSGLTAEIDAGTSEIPDFEIGTGPARKSR
ncbi:MAG: hypothetical protein BGO49_17355 [Planctomycetales bacterium 71-10]|nr:MAG: hypothetical protein BGO49_17355 [Planctomycetales bacterium 71-10]